MDQSFNNLEQSLNNIENIFQNLQPSKEQKDFKDLHEQLEVLERIYMDMLINLEGLVQKSDIYNEANEANEISKKKINEFLDHLEHFHTRIYNMRNMLDKNGTNAQLIGCKINLKTTDKKVNSEEASILPERVEKVNKRDKFSIKNKEVGHKIKKVENEMRLGISSQDYKHNPHENIGVFTVDKSSFNLNNLLSTFCNRKTVAVLFGINESILSQDKLEFLKKTTANRKKLLYISNGDSEQNFVEISFNFKKEGNVFGRKIEAPTFLKPCQTFQSKQKEIKHISSNFYDHHPHLQNLLKDSFENEDQTEPLSENDTTFNEDDDVDQNDGAEKLQKMIHIRNKENNTLRAKMEKNLITSDAGSDHQLSKKDEEKKVCKNFEKELEKLRKWIKSEEDRMKNVCSSKQRVDKEKQKRNKRGLRRLIEFCAFLRHEFKQEDSILIVEKFLKKRLACIECYNMYI